MRGYRLLHLSFCLTFCCLAGCDELDNAMSTDRKPVTPPGLAGASDIDDVQQAAQGGMNNQTPPAGATQQPPAQAAQQPAQPNRGIIGKTTAQIVDAQRAKQNPRIVEVENKISGSDPWTVAGSAYVSATSRVSTLGMQQALRQHQALNGQPPSYDEFMQMVKQNRVEFSMLPPYQMYGYDAKSGGIVILEDKADKIRRYREKNIPLDPGDERFQ